MELNLKVVMELNLKVKFLLIKGINRLHVYVMSIF